MSGLPIKGSWAAQNVPVSYTTAAIWGSGISDVHSQYGEGAPLRVQGRGDSRPEVHAPYGAQPDFLELHAPWGYTNEDQAATPYLRDGWPDPSESITETRATNTTHRPPYNAPGVGKTLIRSIFDGARKANYKQADSLPNETVTEGWRNKAKGDIADAEPADPSNYETQTSMKQRYAVRANDLAVERGTDEPRASIGSRVAGQKLKVYSGEERHYDMDPYQQDAILRPFWYRRAGTGNPDAMAVNEMFVQTPMQRVPPPDPSLGIDETDPSLDYGYTPEDVYYA